MLPDQALVARTFEVMARLTWGAGFGCRAQLCPSRAGLLFPSCLLGEWYEYVNFEAGMGFVLPDWLDHIV